MREGQRLEDEMGVGIEEAHLLMCLLTENSLASPPVVEGAQAGAAQVRARGPAGGDARRVRARRHPPEVTRRTWPVLRRDFAATWSGGVLPNATDPLSFDDAAAMAAKAVSAVYPPWGRPGRRRLAAAAHHPRHRRG